MYFTRSELSFKKVINVFKLSSSGPCETRRAHWIPCENPLSDLQFKNNLQLATWLHSDINIFFRKYVA